jgi:hypothetical protein
MTAKPARASLAAPMIAAAVALMVGLVVGGLGPRAELRALRAKVDAAEACRTSVDAADLAGVFSGRPWSNGPRPDAPPIDDAEPAVAPPTEIDVDEPSDLEPEPTPTPSEGGPVIPELDAAREAMTLRSRQAWRALDEQANPTPEQREAIEAAIGAMNDELIGVADELVARMEAGERPERRDLMIFAADTLETMISAEDAIYESLTPEQREAVDPEVLDPTAYVDASILDALDALGRAP